MTKAKRGLVEDVLWIISIALIGLLLGAAVVCGQRLMQYTIPEPEKDVRLLICMTDEVETIERCKVFEKEE